MIILDVLLPALLFGLAIFGIIVAFQMDNIVLTIGKNDRLYHKFKTAANDLGIELNAEFILGARMVFVVVCCVIGLALVVSMNRFFMFPFIFAFGAYYYPINWIGTKEKERNKELTSEFPLMVSLLRVYSRAGGLYQSLKIVRNAVKGELRRQLDILNVELEIYPLHEALDRLSYRCKYPPLTNLVSVILMGIKNGNDVDQILEKFSNAAYKTRVDELKRKIKAQPIIMTLMPAMLMFALLLLIVYPMFSNIITSINTF